MNRKYAAGLILSAAIATSAPASQPAPESQIDLELTVTSQTSATITGVISYRGSLAQIAALPTAHLNVENRITATTSADNILENAHEEQYEYTVASIGDTSRWANAVVLDTAQGNNPGEPDWQYAELVVQVSLIVDGTVWDIATDSLYAMNVNGRIVPLTYDQLKQARAEGAGMDAAASTLKARRYLPCACQ